MYGEEASCILQTQDNGFIICGQTYSNDLFGFQGNRDVLVIKIDSSGTLQWQKCLGGTGEDVAINMLIAEDGNYVIAASTRSNDGDVNGNHG